MCGVVWCKSTQILAISNTKLLFLQPFDEKPNNYDTNKCKL